MTMMRSRRATLALLLVLALSAQSSHAFVGSNLKGLKQQQRQQQQPLPSISTLTSIQHQHQQVLARSTGQNTGRNTVGATHGATSTSLSMNAAAVGTFLKTTQATLHGDPSFVLTAVLLLSVFGVTLERRTMVGKALSAPLATMGLALTVANLGIVPFVSPLYTMINKFLVPLAVPLLLFDSDLKRVFNDTGSLLLCFFIGAFSTIVGTLVAYPMLPLYALGKDTGWRVACALAARHIGGAINFVAVAETLNIPGTAVSAAIAADNVVVALYFALLFSLAKEGEDDGDGSDLVGDEAKDSKSEIVVDVADPEDVSNESASNGITLPTLGISLSVASLLVTLGRILTRAILPIGTSSLPLTSILTVFAATAFPKFFSKLRSAGTAVGILFIQLFFAASGAAGNLGLVLRSAPSLFAFSILQIGVHFGVLNVIGRFVFKCKPRELYLASNANVGGPTTAAAMAQAKEWKRLVLPALLIGILGYASATAIALALGPILLRMPIASFALT